MPVVTPVRASMLTVNAVPRAGRGGRGPTIIGSSSARPALRSSVRQMSPRPNFAMKLIASAAAITRITIGGHPQRVVQVALVLAVLVVDEDHHLALAREHVSRSPPDGAPARWCARACAGRASPKRRALVGDLVEG
jgi:hypothetical protein